MPKIRFYYCDYCDKEIEHPIRKSLDEMEKTILAIVFLSTIGVGILVSLILIIMLNPMSFWATLITLGVTILVYELYNRVLRRPIYCPTCESKLQVSEQAFMKPATMITDPKTPKQRVLEKVEKAKKTITRKIVEQSEEEIITCPYCGHVLDDEYESCPYCKSML